MWSSSSIELLAPAKLNLCLEVLGRRPDGYHEIDSVLTTIDLCDRIRLERADSLSCEVEGCAPGGEANLAFRAAAALGVGARIRLEKHIPAGAGLGGASSDAAAVLQGLNRLYGLDLGRERLHDLAARLGSDVPFFLEGGLARCRGVGDRILPLQSPGTRRFLLVCPAIHTATKAVYRALDAGLTGNTETATFFIGRYLGPEGAGSTPYRNGLQGVAEGLDPRLAEVRRRADVLFGSAFTMTGTGSAYFAEWDGGSRCAEGFDIEGGVPVRVLGVQTRERAPWK